MSPVSVMELLRRQARASRTIVVGLAFALGVGCDSPGGKNSCVNDDTCGGGVCVQGMCLMRPAGRTVAVEIVPSSASLAVTTELLGITLSDAPLVLAADDKAAITGKVMSPESLYAMEAHVAIGIPSRIPGRDNLQIIAEMAENQFGFTVPRGRVGPDTIASFRFLPGSTSQMQPPIPLTAPLTSMLNLMFPTSEQMTFVRARLLGPGGLLPYVGEAYPARVSFNGVPVSNVLAADSTGSFTLLVPPGATSAAPNDRVTLTVGTADNPDNVPVFITTALPLDELGTPATPVSAPRIYTMPAFQPAMPVTLRVMGEANAQAGVTVRLRTDIPALDGVARYERTAVTDSQGEVTVLVIPGPADAPLVYQASIEAPADESFRYASQCVGNMLIALGPSGAIADPAVIDLQPKLELSGSVSDNTAAPVPGARVTATQMGGGTVCADSATPNMVSTTTGANGTYVLLVPPGVYRLNVIPSPSSAWPRLVETAAVTVTHARVFPIQLPAGEVVKGTVFASDTFTVLPNASIRIFQVCCQSAPCDCATPPIVLADTQTNANGDFQAVLPVAAPP